MEFTEAVKRIKRLLIGGAVRDILLGLEPKDRDWLVVGQTPESMRALGFEPNGVTISAPVYIHHGDPDREQYALPRTEKSVGNGYHDFIFDTQGVSVEDDLRRRDFTINAMAQREDGSIIDPFGGQADLKEGRLRHIDAEAFQEDPLRVLRACRFAARYTLMLDPELRQLCKNMVKQDMLAAIPAERIYQEFKKALVECHRPSLFFRFLVELGALEKVAPELAMLVGIPQPELHHQEGDVFNHSLLVLNQARRLTKDTSVLMAALCHDLGKAMTPPDQWPHHHDHENLGENLMSSLASRLKMDSRTLQYCKLAMKQHMLFHRILELSPGRVVKLFGDLRVIHGRELLNVFLILGDADALGRIPMDQSGWYKSKYLNHLADAYGAIRMRDSEGRSLEVKKAVLVQDRVNAIKHAMKTFSV